MIEINNNWKKTGFYVPHKVQSHFGSIYDHKGDLVDLKERGLDGECNEDQNGVVYGYKHQWLLLPQQVNQKQYLECIWCGERSHL